MPLAEVRRFRCDAIRDKAFRPTAFDFSAEANSEIGRRVVDWITSENQEQINFAAAHIVDERFQRIGAIHRIGIDWLGIKNRLADIA